ncbi:MAG: hypothetical protein QM526_01400 [Alphaproteobacteria bacterium]|nr:hypothetical protein [Alphaproteobacteria bacterium]
MNFLFIKKNSYRFFLIFCFVIVGSTISIVGIVFTIHPDRITMLHTVPTLLERVYADSDIYIQKKDSSQTSVFQKTTFTFASTILNSHVALIKKIVSITLDRVVIKEKDTL